MSIENVKALAEILNKNGLTSLEYCEGDTKIKLEKAVTQTVMPEPVQIVKQSEPQENKVVENNNETLDFNNIIEVNSPLVGVFYSAPSPDSEPFVTIGSKVRKGDVLCIIEAMKLMNEVTAEQDGEIVDICVKNGDITEFGQVLFKMY